MEADHIEPAGCIKFVGFRSYRLLITQLAVSYNVIVGNVVFSIILYGTAGLALPSLSRTPNTASIFQEWNAGEFYPNTTIVDYGNTVMFAAQNAGITLGTTLFYWGFTHFLSPINCEYYGCSLPQGREHFCTTQSPQRLRNLFLVTRMLAAVAMLATVWLAFVWDQHFAHWHPDFWSSPFASCLMVVLVHGFASSVFISGLRLRRYAEKEHKKNCLDIPRILMD